MTSRRHVNAVALLCFCIAAAVAEVRGGSARDDKQLWLDGNFVIGGIFPTRLIDLSTLGEDYDKLRCSELVVDFYVIQAEAFVYAIDYANKHILNGTELRLGAWAVDSCGMPQFAFQQGIRFIAMGNNTNFCVRPEDQLTVKPGQRQSYGYYQTVKNSPTFSPSQTQRNVMPYSSNERMIAVTGTFSSSTAVALAPLFQYFCIPLIGSTTTSDELTPENFKYFMRTSPTDSSEIAAMIQLLLQFDWRVGHLVCEESEYGRKLCQNFKSTVDAENVSFCFHEHNLHSHGLDAKDLRSLFSGDADRAKVIVILGGIEFFRVFLATLYTTGNGDAYQYVGSDAWMISNFDKTDVLPMLENSVSLVPKLKDDEAFMRYLTALTLQDASKNPWMVELFEQQYSCCFERACASVKCTGAERLARGLIDPVAVRYAHATIEAIALVANALLQAHSLRCPGSGGRYCDAMRENFTGCWFRSLLRATHVSYPGFAEFTFDNSSSAPPLFSVIQFQRRTEDGKFGWTEVGIVDARESPPSMTINRTVFRNGRRKEHIDKAVSDCFQVCGPGEEHAYDELLEHCCWSCKKCSRVYDIVVADNETARCYDLCAIDKIPSDDFSRCVPAEMTPFASASALVMSGIIFLGFLPTVLSIFVLIRHRETPFVRKIFGSFSAALPASVALLFVASVLLLAPPSTVLCTVALCCWTTAATSAFSVLFAKTIRMFLFNDAYRIYYLRSSRFENVLSYQGPLVRYILVVMLFLQAFIVTIWLLVAGLPSILWIRDQATVRTYACCSFTQSPTTIAAMGPSLLLACATAYLAFLTKNSSLWHFRRESRQCMLASLLYLASFTFVVGFLYSTNDNIAFVESLSDCLTLLPALILFVTVVAPNVYIIVWRPEKNNEETFKQRSDTHRQKMSNGGIVVVRMTQQESAPPTRRCSAQSVSFGDVTEFAAVSPPPDQLENTAAARRRSFREATLTSKLSALSFTSEISEAGTDLTSCSFSCPASPTDRPSVNDVGVQTD